MRQFQFEKTYEEIQVGENVYKLDFSDDKRKEYVKQIGQFHQDFQKLDKKDHNAMDEKEALAHFEEIKGITKQLIEALLGKDTFDQLYEDSGRSIMNVFDFIAYLKTIVEEKNQRNLQSKREQYVK